jgi:hypothetical protein
LWGSIAVLAGTIEEMQSNDTDGIPSTVPSTIFWKSDLMKEIDRIERAAMNTVNEIVTDVQLRVSTLLQQAVVDATKRDNDLLYLERMVIVLHEDVKKVNLREVNMKLESLKDDFEKSDVSNEDILFKVADSIAVLKGELEDLRREARANRFRSAGNSAAPSSNSNCSNYLPLTAFYTKSALWESRMDSMQAQISTLIAESDGDAIKSFGLGFRDPTSSEVWFNTNMDDEAFGLMVDVHLVFENLDHMLNPNESTIKTLHSIEKLGLSNMTQALCLTSFDARVPKLLSKSSNLAFPTWSSKGVSHFDKVDAYSDWEDLNFGMRDKIKNALNSFEASHQQQINTHWPDDLARGRVLATKALAASVLWITQFMSFIDDIYNSFYRHSSFSAEKAWELTTQLGRRIFVELATPRDGVSIAIRVGQGTSRRNLIVFWPMLKSHDVMKAFRDANFRDHPAISSEYVKFLTANSGGDNVDKRFAALKEEVVAALKIAKAANDSAVKAMNIADEQKKRIVELEKKPKEFKKG